MFKKIILTYPKRELNIHEVINKSYYYLFHIINLLYKILKDILIYYIVQKVKKILIVIY